MIKFKGLLILSLSLSLTGCVTTRTTDVPGDFNYSTGKQDFVRYSNTFEGESELFKNAVKVMVEGKISSDLIQAISKTANKIKKVDPEELSYLAEVNVYFHNTTQRNIPFKVEVIRFDGIDYFKQTKAFILIPNTVERITLEGVETMNYETSWTMELVYGIGDKHKFKTLNLKRLTLDEFKSRKPAWSLF